MKSNLLIAALVILTTSITFSNSMRDTLSVTRKDSSSVYLVNYTNRNPGKVTFTIKDNKGTILLKRIILNETGFTMPVNLSSVEEGVYTVHTDNGAEKQNATIRYNNNTAPTYSRIVSLGENRYLFTATHAGRETITIKIYDTNNDLIFRENRIIEGFFSVIFNMKNIAGIPFFEVSETSGNSLMVPGNPIVSILSKLKGEK